MNVINWSPAEVTDFASHLNAGIHALPSSADALKCRIAEVVEMMAPGSSKWTGNTQEVKKNLDRIVDELARLTETRRVVTADVAAGRGNSVAVPALLPGVEDGIAHIGRAVEILRGAGK